MSDKQTDADPMPTLLRERRSELLRAIDDINMRISEIDYWLGQLDDGRSRVNRQRKARTAGNSSAGNMAAIDEVRGILRPGADGAAEQEQESAA